MSYVYLLKDMKGRYYIGHTKNLQKRLKAHNAGYVRSTRHRRPFRLLGFEEYETRSEARWREYNLKKSAYQRQKFIESFRKNGRRPGGNNSASNSRVSDRNNAANANTNRNNNNGARCSKTSSCYTILAGKVSRIGEGGCYGKNKRYI